VHQLTSCSRALEILVAPHLLMNLNIIYHVHKKALMNPFLRHLNSAQSLIFCLRFTSVGLPSSNIHSGFPTKFIYAFFSSMCATCLTYLILLGLNTLLIVREAYKLRSSSLCSLLQPPATSSHLSPNILISTMFTDNLNLSERRR
jgi:hypothetical protein